LKKIRPDPAKIFGRDNGHAGAFRLQRICNKRTLLAMLINPCCARGSSFPRHLPAIVSPVFGKEKFDMDTNLANPGMGVAPCPGIPRG